MATLAVWSAEPVPRIGKPSLLTATYQNIIYLLFDVAYTTTINTTYN